MKTILIIIGIFTMLTSAVYAEVSQVTVATENIYRITIEICNEAGLTDCQEPFENVAEGETDYTITHEKDQFIWVTVDIIQENYWEDLIDNMLEDSFQGQNKTRLGYFSGDKLLTLSAIGDISAIFGTMSGFTE